MSDCEILSVSFPGPGRQGRQETSLDHLWLDDLPHYGQSGSLSNSAPSSPRSQVLQTNYFNSYATNISEYLKWIPLALVIGSFIGFSIGFATIPFCIMGELLPQR